MAGPPDEPKEGSTPPTAADPASAGAGAPQPAAEPPDVARDAEPSGASWPADPQPDAEQTGADAPDAEQPNAAQPDTAQPDAVQPAAAQADAGLPRTDAERRVRDWAVACHLSALLGLTGVPLLNVIAPLAVWALKRNESALIDDQGKESLNFQISITIYTLVSAILVLMFVGFFLLLGLLVLDLVLIAQAAMAASKGQLYRYPLTIRFIR